MARWLAAPDMGALDQVLETLEPGRLRELGGLLEGAVLLGLTPRSSAVSNTLAELARRAGARQAATLQERWGVSSMPFEFDRLQARLREMRVVGAGVCLGADQGSGASSP